MEESAVLRKVRALIATAEHPETGVSEAKAAREAADRLMLKYAVDEAMARDAASVAAKAKPGKLTVTVSGPKSPYKNYTTLLCEAVAKYCRCKVIYMESDWRDMTGVVFGFESDLAYFEILFTTLQLHLISGLEPKWDAEKSKEDNAYALHNAGLNWLDMARLQGWLPITGTDDWYKMVSQEGARIQKRVTKFSLGSGYKRAYNKAVLARGEEKLRIPAGGRVTFGKNFARAYVARVTARLTEAANRRSTGSDLILRSAMSDVIGAANEAFPEAKTMKMADSVKFNAEAYDRGIRHGDRADLGANRAAGSHAATPIGG